MDEIVNLVKEQCQLTQKLKSSMQPRSSAPRFVQIPPRVNDILASNSTGSKTSVFQFGSKQAIKPSTNTAGPSTNPPTKEVINILEDSEGAMLKKKMCQMKDTLCTIKGVDSYCSVAYSDLCIFLGARYPDRF